MKYTAGFEFPLKLAPWKPLTEPRRPSNLLVVASIAAILSGLFFAAAPAVCAEDDNPTVSITPRAPGRSSQLKTRAASLRVDVNLVLIPVMATDPYERPVRGLKKSDFHVFEDGVEQEISQFFSQEEPVSIGIVLDASASMRKKMDESRRAILEFMKVSTPGDEFSLLKFNDRPVSMGPFTTDTKDIENILPSVQAEGWTSLFDAIYLGINQMKHATHARKVLLVLSDGGDNNSRYTQREIVNLVKEADVRIFSISIFDKSSSLEAITEESGGRAFRVRKLEELPDLAATVSEELHSEYVLGFAPAERPIDGKYRRVKVTAVPHTAGGQPVRTSWKRGYYSPAP
jgi:Ca-activated chloride channel homolog